MNCLAPGIVQKNIIDHNRYEEQQRDECVYYWRNVSPYPMILWDFLGGELHGHEQDAAVRAAKEYVQGAPGTCECGICVCSAQLLMHT